MRAIPDSDSSAFLGFGAGEGDSLFSVLLRLGAKRQRQITQLQFITFLHAFLLIQTVNTIFEKTKAQNDKAAGIQIFISLPDVLLGETEPRLFLARFDCWGVGDLRGFGGGLAGGDGLCLRLGGLAEGESLRVLRGGLDTVLLGGFFGGDREREEEEEELLPDKDADDRLLL